MNISHFMLALVGFSFGCIVGEQQRKHQFGRGIAACFVLGLILALTSCAPTTPQRLEAATASWVEDKQDSGVEVARGGVGRFAPETRATYNSLIAVYGARFYPALVPDQGLTPGAPNGWYYANHFARFHFYVMNGWRTSAMHAKAGKL